MTELKEPKSMAEVHEWRQKAFAKAKGKNPGPEVGLDRRSCENSWRSSGRSKTP